jgi:hypothetical protein
VTFKRVDAETPIVTDEEKKLTFTRIDLAYNFVGKVLFPNGLDGGTHSLSRGNIKKLAIHLGIKKDDTFWEIGVGVPFLAFSLSAAAEGGTVIATDIGESND